MCCSVKSTSQMLIVLSNLATLACQFYQEDRITHEISLHPSAGEI